MTGHVIPLHPGNRENDNAYSSCLSFFLNERAPSTSRAYMQDITYLKEYLGLATVEDVVRFLLESPPLVLNQQIQGWRHFMAEDCRLSPNTTSRRLSAVRALLRTARSLGLTRNDLTLRRVAGGRVRDVRGPDMSTITKMLDRLTRDCSPRAARDACLVCLAVSLGLRRQEIHLINVDDIDVQASVITITGKGGRRQELALPPMTRDLLARWLRYRMALSPTPPLFVNLSANGHLERLSTTSIYKVIRAAGDAVGSPIPVRPHSLRRSAINEALLIRGLFGACAFARHKDIRTTMIYVDIMETVQTEISEILDAGLADGRPGPTANEPVGCEIGETLSWL